MKISKIIVAAGAAMPIAQPALAVDPANHNTASSNTASSNKASSNKASGIIANGGSGDSAGDTVDAKNVPTAQQAAKQVAPASETNADHTGHHTGHHKMKGHGKAAPAPAAKPDAATGDAAAPK